MHTARSFFLALAASSFALPSPGAAQRNMAAQTTRTVTAMRSRTMTTQRSATNFRPLGGGFLRRPPVMRTQPSAITRERPTSIARGAALPIAEVEGVLRASTVRVYANDGLAAAGFVATDDGLIVTAAHVVSDSTSATLLHVAIGDGERVAARVVAYIPAHDIAVLRPERSLGAPPLELHDDADVDVGDPVLTYGHPNADTETIGTGMVSAHGRRSAPLAMPESDPESGGLAQFHDAVQIDTPTAPGSSGGPVTTRDGRVIGITSASVSGATYVVPARQISAVLRMVQRAAGRTVGPWPAYGSSHRVAEPTDDENVWTMHPAHPGNVSDVVVEFGDTGNRYHVTHPDGHRSTSTVTPASLARDVGSPGTELEFAL